MNQEDKLLKIINHYGVMSQLKYFQSEVFEFNEAIIEFETLGKNDCFEEQYDFYKIKKEHIAEEIADVIVMLMQFKEYYHIDGNEILKIMDEKINRQIERIENENNNI